MCVLSCSVVSDFCDPVDYSLPGSSVHGDSPGKDTGVGCHFLLQGIFLTQGSNWHLSCPALAGGFFTPRATWIIQPNTEQSSHSHHNVGLIFHMASSFHEASTVFFQSY